MSELNLPTKIFVVLSIVGIVLVLSFLLFGFNSKESTEVVEYNYYKFSELGGLWQTEIKLDNQMYDALFRFNPVQVEDVYIVGNFTGFKSQPVYIAFDPLSNKDDFKYLALATSELSLHLVRALNVSIEAACTKNETSVCFDRPIVDCSRDASVIVLSSKAPMQISLDGDCVALSGQGFDLLKSVDRLLFQWYKIMGK